MIFPVRDFALHVRSHVSLGMDWHAAAVSKESDTNGSGGPRALGGRAQQRLESATERLVLSSCSFGQIWPSSTDIVNIWTSPRRNLLNSGRIRLSSAKLGYMFARFGRPKSQTVDGFRTELGRIRMPKSLIFGRFSGHAAQKGGLKPAAQCLASAARPRFRAVRRAAPPLGASRG